MVVFLTLANIFGFNLLCSIVNCGPRFELPSDPLLEDSENTIQNFNNDAFKRVTSRIGYGRALDIDEDIRENPVVFTNHGGVEGYVMKTISKRKIYAFQGIPYGENTGGSNRFKSPIPKTPWAGVRHAKDPGPYCPQIGINFFIKGREDCLTLNIYAIPNAKINNGKTKTKGTLPVVVWIHGGAFAVGSASEYGPSYLLDSHDMIFVSMNYRVGILGFLTTGDSSSPGNYGLKDQALALKWVYENIEHFGGNKSQITLMGHSAGAASVHLHMLSKKSRKYFSAAISLSGSAFNIWAVRRPPFTDIVNERLARFTNCPLKPSSEFVECLRKFTALGLTRNQAYLQDWLGFPSCPLAPTIEPEGEDAFITKSPEEYYKSNDVAKVPWIVTRTKDEALFGFIVVQVLLLSGHVSRHLKSKLPVILEYRLLPDNIPEITEKILNYYTETLNYNNFTELITEVSTDRFFSYGIHKSIQAHSKVAPTYSYIFNVRGEHNFPTYFNMEPKAWGVSHSDDIWYLMNTTFSNAWKTTEYGYPLVRFMTDLISNFATVREPLHRDSNGKYWKVWEAVTDPENVKYLSIEEKIIKMVPEPNLERFKFWESLNLPDMRPLDKNFIPEFLAPLPK